MRSAFAAFLLQLCLMSSQAQTPSLKFRCPLFLILCVYVHMLVNHFLVFFAMIKHDGQSNLQNLVLRISEG